MTPSPASLESARMDALTSYAILDSLPEEDYDAITRIASQLCEMPISLITLLDDHRQWFKSSVGMADRQTPRKYAFCDHAIRKSDELMEVPDARLDSRFVDNPLTTGEPHVIFYAGVPLVDNQGLALGALCVIDNKPNKLSDQQAATLKSLARQVVNLLTLRRSQAQLAAANQTLQTLNADLHTNNRVLQAVVDNCPAGLVLWQAMRENGQIVDFEYVLTNDFNAAIVGMTVPQMIGSTLKTLFPGVRNSSILQRLTAVVETGERQTYRQHDRFDQIDMWGDYLLVPLGEQVLMAYQDITELKKNETDLRSYSDNLEQMVSDRTAEISQLSALQNAILQYAGFAIISTDEAGLIQTVNPATRHLLGYDDDELVGRVNVSTLCDPRALAHKVKILGDQLGRLVPADFSLFKLIQNDRSYECTMLARDGRPIPVLLITTPLRNSQETIIGYIVMVTDITALKNARAELQQRSQELNTFFEVALDLHCIATIDGAILKVNRAWETTLGYTTDELLRMNHFDLIHPSDREATRVVIGGTTPHHTYMNHINRFQHKDGSFRVIEWNVVAIDNVLYASARDITERQQAEKELKRANQRLELATQAADQGIWEYNRERDILNWDERMYAIHGLGPTNKNLCLQDYHRLLHPDDLTSFEQRRMHNLGEAFVDERRVIWPDGTIRYTELHGIRTVDKAGRPLGSVGVVRDITERKQGEFALRRSEERYRLLVDNLKEVVFQTDQQGELTFLNPFWKTMTGYNVDESLGQPFYNYISPEGQLKSQAMFKEFVAHRKTSARLVIRYRHKAGYDCWAEIFTQVLTDDSGQPTGTAGTVTDITERKQAMDDLRRSEQRFRDIAENINEIFWIHAAQTMQLLYVNPVYEAITGLSISDAHDNPLDYLKLVAEEDQLLLKTAYARYIRSEAVNVQFRVTIASGELRWFDIRTFVKKSTAGVALSYIGIATDITSQKEKEVVLQQSLAREQELNRLKSQFVSTASHEFRTPLATIQSSVDLIKLYTSQPPAKAQPAIQRHLLVIEKEIANFSGLLADMLTFGKIEAGKIPFTPQWVDMLALAETVITTHFSERTDHRTVELTVAGTPRPIFADPTLMSHALVNLLSNAFKFSSENTGLHLSFSESKFILTVSDTGIGIPADDMTHLFETFFRAQNAINIQGSGMGLVITRQFIERHGGQLTLESQENKGTTCTIVLPEQEQPSVRPGLA